MIAFCPYNPPNIYYKHPNLGSSLVYVTQSIIQRVHQFIDDILVHNTIRRDRRGELREGSLTEQRLIKRLRTFVKGGDPFGKTGSPLTTPTEPPVNDQKFAGLAFCQSYQSLSIIWGRICQKIGLLALIRRTAWCIISKGSIEMPELYITLTRGLPLGDHLGPGVQPAGAVDGQFPKRSLRGVCEGAKPRCI